MTRIRKGRALAAVVAASSVAAPAALADRAEWRDGFYEGHGEGNVCIAFEVRASKVKWLRVEGAPECGHRFRCTGRLMRSAPGAAAKALRIKRNGRFRHQVDITRDPPRPGPPARRIATFITGKLRGAKAQYLSGF